MECYLCNAPGGEVGCEIDTSLVTLRYYTVHIIVNFSNLFFKKKNVLPIIANFWSVCLFEVVPLISFAPSMFRGANTLIKTKQI